MSEYLTTSRDALQAMIKLPKFEEEKIYLEEHVFRKTWFPVFMRYFAHHEEGIVAMWAVNVAQGYYNKVYVVSDINNPEQTIQFVVPPLLSRAGEVYNEQIASRISDIIATANLSNESFPGSGDNLLDDSLVKQINPPIGYPEEEEMWKKIYKYYDVDAEFLHKENKNQKTTNTSSTFSESEIEYDEDF